MNEQARALDSFPENKCFTLCTHKVTHCTPDPGPPTPGLANVYAKHTRDIDMYTQNTLINNKLMNKNL